MLDLDHSAFLSGVDTHTRLYLCKKSESILGTATDRSDYVTSIKALHFSERHVEANVGAVGRVKTAGIGRHPSWFEFGRTASPRPSLFTTSPCLRLCLCAFSPHG